MFHVDKASCLLSIQKQAATSKQLGFLQKLFSLAKCWYDAVLQEERERPYRSLEQQMAAYRQECETRLQEEVRRQVQLLLTFHKVDIAHETKFENGPVAEADRTQQEKLMTYQHVQAIVGIKHHG